MRAVLDLNVYVSALINPAGTPSQVVRLGLQRRYEIVVCPALLTELHEVLSRETLRRYFTPWRWRNTCRCRIPRARSPLPNWRRPDGPTSL